MTTSKPPDSTALAERLVALPRDSGGPVFAEPWQAEVFALAVKLSEQGHFTWKEWASTLAEELKAAADRGEPDDGSHYYHHWLAALERLVTTKGLTSRAALETSQFVGGGRDGASMALVIDLPATRLLRRAR